MNTVIDGQVLPTEPASTALVPAQPTMIRPLATPDEALANWQAFQELKAKLITKDDLQHVGGRDRITKSGWRKVAAVFGINVELLAERRIPHANGNGFVVECTVRASAPNGRYNDGVGSFDTNERKMAHLEHDVRATAYTRAANRAISDLVGGGEVSAEEIQAERAPQLTRDEATKLCADFGRALADAGISTDPANGQRILQEVVIARGDLRRAYLALKAALRPAESQHEGHDDEPTEEVC
jgi:hypothetical protein